MTLYRRKGRSNWYYRKDTKGRIIKRQLSKSYAKKLNLRLKKKSVKVKPSIFKLPVKPLIDFFLFQTFPKRDGTFTIYYKKRNKFYHIRKEDRIIKNRNQFTKALRDYFDRLSQLDDADRYYFTFD